MAAIAQTSMRTVGSAAVTLTTAAASPATDTLSYAPGTFQVLEIRNTTGTSKTVTITGSTATTIVPPGYGGTINVATGKVITVPANSTVIVALDSISGYLSGNITTASSGTAGEIVYALYGL